MTPDVHALTGAYVLNSVSDDERADFERHLRECEPCAQEVRELRATTTRLALAAAAVAPPRLKNAVMGQIRQVRQDPPQATVTRLRGRRTSWPSRLVSAAAAVALVAAGVFGVLLVQSRQEVQDAEAARSAMSTILEAEDARVVASEGRDGGRMTVLVSRSADRALLLARGLPELTGGQVYQAWTIGEQAESAGLLPAGTTTFEVDGIAAAGAIGVTVEPAGGSTQPTLENLVLNLTLS